MVTIARVILFFVIAGQSCLLNASDAANKYLFLEQHNDLCIIAPMANLKRLEDLKERFPQAFGRELTDADHAKKPHELFNKYIPAAEFFNKRIWLGRAHNGTIKFYGLFTTERISAAEPTALYQFIRRATEQAPVVPNFYFADGTEYLSYRPGRIRATDALTNAPSAAKLMYSPYFLIDMEAISQNKVFQALNDGGAGHGVMLPMGVEKDKFFVFSSVTNNYELIGMPTPKVMAHKVLQQIKRAETSANAGKDALIASLQERFPTMGIPFDHPVEYIMSDGRYLAGLTDKEGFAWLRPFVGQYGLNWGASSLGFEQVAYAAGPGDFAYPADSKDRYSTYMHGLGKMTYLRLGINFDNEPLREDTEDELEQLSYRASQDLAAQCQAQEAELPSDCWWSSTHFSREKYLNYQIAALFKADPELKAQAMATVDYGAIQTWACYTGFVRSLQNGLLYHDKKHERQIIYDQAKYFMPGEEQALAACVLNKVRQLLYASLAPAAFYEGTIEFLGNTFARFAARHFFNFDHGSDRSIKQAQQQKKVIMPNRTANQRSFVQVWQQLLTELKLAHPERTDWICFDFHGWVLSWDPFLVALQREHLMKTAKLKSSDQRVHLLDNLGVAVIESWLSNKLNAFYVKKG